MATYVTDGKGNRYERRYNEKTKTYTDHYVGKARGDEAKGNPDKNTGYSPGNTNKNGKSSSNGSISFIDRDTGKRVYTSIDQYAQSQAQRFREAVSSGDTDLINRLVRDAERVGYSLPSITPEIETPLQQVMPEIEKPIPSWQEMYPMPQFQMPKVDLLEYDEAKQRAIERLKPMYEDTRKDLLERSAIRSEQRGIGFSPLAEQIDLKLETDLAGQYNQDVSSMANSLVGQSQDRADKLVQLALQQYQAQLQSWGQQMENYWRSQEHQRNLENDKFNQMRMMKELGLDEMKIALAEDELDFKRWLAERNLELDYAKLDLQERSMLVDKYIAERQISSSESMFNRELDWKASQNQLDRDLKRELDGGKDSMATQQWISYMDEAIQDGDLRTFDDAFEIIMENWNEIQKDNADPYYILEKARSKLGK